MRISKTLTLEYLENGGMKLISRVEYKGIGNVTEVDVNTITLSSEEKQDLWYELHHTS